MTRITEIVESFTQTILQSHGQVGCVSQTTSQNKFSAQTVMKKRSTMSVRAALWWNDEGEIQLSEINITASDYADAREILALIATYDSGAGREKGKNKLKGGPSI